MKLSRRSMTLGAIGSVFGLASSAKSKAANALGTTPTSTHSNPLPNRVAAGDVTDRSAVVWARPQRFGFVFFQVSRHANFRRSRTRVGFVRDARIPLKAEFTHLRPGTQYHYRVFNGFRNVSEGTFQTSQAPGQRKGFRFGVTGDQRGELAPYPSVRNAVDRDLELFVELGDTIYADFPSPNVPLAQATTFGDFLAKNEEVYADRQGLNTLAELRSRVAWLAMIDDHEVTNDFAGGAAPSSDPRFAATTETFINETELYRNGIEAFELFHPSRTRKYGGTGDARVDGRPDLYRTHRSGDDAAIFVLDARSFRDQLLPAVTDPTDPVQVQTFLAQSFDPTRTMLGQPQLNRLLNDLL